MLQYIINLTATWLLSLVIFELFLKKETYHTYNRIYLLSTFLIGMFLPLWSWGSSDAVTVETNTGTIEKLATIRQSIATTANHARFSLTWQQSLWYVYLAGCLVALILLVYEVSKIMVLYQVGIKSKEDKWTVVETVKGHAPFSIFHILFVDSKEQYTPEQWAIILDHEEQHSSLGHFFDQLIMQLARIVFWFHPLVYIYNNRLMLLHEYQADKISGKQPAIYGKFLVEQALLHTAPALSHSLNRSPIKTRIMMLTRNSSFLGKSKALLFIPLVFICAFCFSKNQYPNKIEKHGNIATYRGNTFEFTPESKPDTMTVINPTTGKENMLIVRRTPYPIKMNNEKIYSYDDLEGKKNAIGKPSNNPAGFNADNMREYLITNLTEEFRSLPDNDYIINLENIVIDKNGSIVYFEFEGVRTYKQPFVDSPKTGDIDKTIQERIANKVYDLLNNAPAHSPGVIDGRDIPFLIKGDAIFRNAFTIKNHKVTRI